jgi:hypothetical protein
MAHPRAVDRPGIGSATLCVVTNRSALNRRPARRSLRRVGVLVALSGSLAVSGCAVMSPQQTDLPHLVSDGVSLDLSPEVGLRGVVVVADKKGGPGTVVGQVFNNSAKPATVDVGIDGAKSSLTVAPGESKTLSGSGSELKVSSVPSDPGGVVQLQASLDGQGDNVVTAPVLPATGYYSSGTGQ